MNIKIRAKKSGIFENTFDCVFSIIQFIFVSKHLADCLKSQKYKNGIMDFYILIQIFVLVNYSFTIDSLSGRSLCCPKLFYFLSFYWMAEILHYPIRTIFYGKNNNSSSTNRKLILTFVDYMTLILIFGNLYVISGEVVKGTEVLHGKINSIYFSCATALTIGYGDFVPTGNWSKSLVVLQGFVFLGYVLIFLGYYVNKIIDK
jgi:hypothetical protein